MPSSFKYTDVGENNQRHLKGQGWILISAKAEQSPNNSKKNSGCTQGCNWDEIWSWSAALQTEKRWCAHLKFQGKLSKESQVLLGHFYSSWKKPVCSHLHMMPPGHQLQHALDQTGRLAPSTCSSACFKTKQTAFSSGEPAGNSPFLRTKGAWDTGMLPWGNLCNPRISLFFPSRTGA